MSYNDYASLNTLEDISFIAGTTYNIDYTISENGIPVELDGMIFSWKMSKYGVKNYVVLEKNDSQIIALDLYTRRVIITAEDSLNLKGKFSHQVIIVSSGETYRPAQGVITITSAIQ